MLLQYILDCMCGMLAAEHPLAPLTDSGSPAFIASDILNIILIADTPYEIYKQQNERNNDESWSEAIATALLRGLESAIKTGVQMTKASADALTQAKNAAI